MTKYTVHNLDVWGNHTDGFEINDIYPACGSVELDPKADDATVLDTLASGGFIPRNYSRENFTVDDELNGAVIDYRGKPTLMLREAGQD